MTARRPGVAAAFAALLLLLGAALLVGVVQFVWSRLGISGAAALAVLWASLIGSWIDIPVAVIRRGPPRDVLEVVPTWGGIRLRRVAWARGTRVAVNVGGAVVPVAVSFVALANAGVWWQAATATVVVSAVAYTLARVVPGVGVLLPFWAAPLTAALAAVALAPGASAAVAYAAATLGTLIGADLLHLARAAGDGAGALSIGGAGTFDGIFVGGLVAVLLAAL